MLTSHSYGGVRLRALAAIAALVLGMPVGALAQIRESGSVAEKSTSTASHKHVKKDAADELKEMNKHIQKLTKSLKLTNDQVLQVKSILQAQSTRANELRAKSEGQPSSPESRAEMEKAHQDLHADTDAKLGVVLTADQMTKYRAMHSKRMRKEGAKEKEEEKEEKK